MIIAIVHSQSMGILAKFEAKDFLDASNQYLRAHPEYECDTWAEFFNQYPVLANSLWCIPLN